MTWKPPRPTQAYARDAHFAIAAEGDHLGYFSPVNASSAIAYDLESVVSLDARFGWRFACVADVDGDGAVDVVAANKVAGFISWYGRAGPQKHDAWVLKGVLARNVSEPYALECADADGDGHTDVFAALRMDDTIVAFRNRGGGTFSPMQVIATCDQPQDVWAGALRVNPGEGLDAEEPAVAHHPQQWQSCPAQGCPVIFYSCRDAATVEYVALKP